MPPRSVTLAITGASGTRYGIRLLEQLLTCELRVHFLYSRAAEVVARQELGLNFAADAAATQKQLEQLFPGQCRNLSVYALDDWFAPVASGSGVSDAMVVCPCSMGTVAAIAHGLSDNLVQRAADVSLKERKPLVLVPRETPFSAIHLENLLQLARLGVSILPASPGFYHQPDTIDELIDFVVARILDHLAIPNRLSARWGDAAAR